VRSYEPCSTEADIESGRLTTITRTFSLNPLISKLELVFTIDQYILVSKVFAFLILRSWLDEGLQNLERRQS
jgi:hypothetical protein